MRDKKRKAILSVLIFSSVLLILVGGSYAYLAFWEMEYAPTIDGELDYSVATASDLKLIYTDCAEATKSDCESIRKNLEPGESIEKTFKIKNDSVYDLKYTIYFQNLLNTFVDGELVYKLETLDGKNTIVSTVAVPYKEHLAIDVPIKEDIFINKNEEQAYKLTVTFLNTAYDQIANLDAEYYMTLGFVPSNRSKAPVVNAYAREVSPNFKEEATSDEGLYTLEDDYGLSYYYRGDVKNNYVKFADLYWRIIRINGDGSVRMIYDGTMPHENSENSSDRVIANEISWNNQTGDAKYVGYMYDDGINSNIKGILDDWYKVNILDRGYSTAVKDAIFCNDRSFSTGDGIGDTYYGANKRIRTDVKPSFVCPSKSDAYTVSDTLKGNGALEYPVGLITADELLASGLGSFDTGSTRNYLYKGSMYWTMTPDAYISGKPYNFYMAGGDIGKIYSDNNNLKGAVAPVINLTKEYASKLEGTGTIDDPYVATIE